MLRRLRHATKPVAPRRAADRALRAGEMVEAARLARRRRARRVARHHRILQRHRLAGRSGSRSAARWWRPALSMPSSCAVSSSSTCSPIASGASPAARREKTGLVTGYYEPLLRGSRERTGAVRDAAVSPARRSAARRSRRGDPRAQGQTRARPARRQQGGALLQPRRHRARRPGSPATRSCGSTMRSTPSCSRSRARAACS